jgi:hypothetical protein
MKLNSCCQVKSDTQCENNVSLVIGKNIRIVVYLSGQVNLIYNTTFP